MGEIQFHGTEVVRSAQGRWYEVYSTCARYSNKKTARYQDVARKKWSRYGWLKYKGINEVYLRTLIQFLILCVVRHAKALKSRPQSQDLPEG